MGKCMWLWLATCAAALAGCQHEVYQVDMAVEGDQIVRSFSVHVESSGDAGALITDAKAQHPTTQPARAPGAGPSTRTAASSLPAAGVSATQPSPLLAAIARLYKVGPDAPQPWKGRFTGRTPDDVGGAGQVGFFPSDMGSAWIYLERFRGDDDPASALVERLQAADTIASVVAGWARARLGDRKGFDKLGAYLDGDLHKDLRNLSLLLWTAGAVRGMNTSEPSASSMFEVHGPILASSAQVDVAAVALQYLIERKYLDVEDAPAILRLLQWSSDEERLTRIKTLWRKTLTRKIGLTDKDLLDHLVGIFDRGEEVQKSLASYVEGRKEYKEYLAKPRTQAPSGGPPGPDEPTVEGFLKAQLEAAFTPVGIDVLNADNELRLTLETKEVPIFTNGKWDQQAGKVSWQRRFSAPSSQVKDPLPAVCFAVWARPDELFQKKHFGKAILRGQSLVEYCLWRSGLSAEEARRWDGIMSSIRPGADLDALARSSTTQPPGDRDRQDIIDAGLRILQAALGD